MGEGELDEAEMGAEPRPRLVHKIGRALRRLSTLLTRPTDLNYVFWVMTAVAARSGRSVLDDILRDLHAPGAERAVSASGFRSALAFLDGSQTDSLLVWEDWDQSLQLIGQRLSSDRVVMFWIVADIVFSLSLFILLKMWSQARRKRLESVDESQVPHRATYRALLEPASRLAATGFGAVVVADALLLSAVWRDAVDGRAPLAVSSVASLVAAAAFVTAGAAIVVSYRARIPGTGHRAFRRSVWQTALDLRAQILAVSLGVIALTQLPGNVRPQLHDLIRTWRDAPFQGVFALGTLAVLSVMLAFTSVSVQRSLRDDQLDTDDGRRRRVVFALALALAVAGAVAHWLVLGNGAAFWIAALVLALFGLASLITGIDGVRARRVDYQFQGIVARLLIGLPIYALAIAWMRAETSSLLERWDWYLVLTSLVIFVGVGVIVYFLRTLKVPTWIHPKGRIIEIVSLLVGVAALALLWLASANHDVAWDIGALGSLGLAGIAVLGIGHGIVFLFRRPPSGPLGLIGFRRTPVLLSFVLLAVGITVVVSSPGFHRADIDTATPTADSAGIARSSPGTLTESFASWVDDDTVGTTPGDDMTWQPMVIFASSGGGARAAYWSLLTFDCLFADEPLDPVGDRATPACDRNGDAPPQWDDVFAASGISGGSVGLAVFDSVDNGDTYRSPEDVFSENGFIDPVVSRLLALDLPNSFLLADRFAGWDLHDRAEALEQAMIDRVPGLADPFLDEAGDESDGPVLVLNSATVEDGCRVAISNVAVAASTDTDPDTPFTLSGGCRSFVNARVATPADPPDDGSIAPPIGWPATRDLSSILCDDQNLSSATAATLSARFPFVSPSGAIEYCGDDGRYTYLVDGGTVDSSAAAPAVLIVRELLDQVRQHNENRPDGAACVQPVVVQLDNGYEDVVAQGSAPRPSELAVPLQSGLSAITKNADNARQELALLGTSLREMSGCTAAEIPDLPTYLQVFPVNHPGTEAPLGWSLSPVARRDMRDQLTSAPNQCSLLGLRYWMTGRADGGGCITGNVTLFEPGESEDDLDEPDAAVPDRVEQPADPVEGDVGSAARAETVCVPNGDGGSVRVKTNAFGWFARAYGSRSEPLAALGDVPTDDACDRAVLCDTNSTYGVEGFLDLGYDLCVSL